ncbi:GntR family transcriptional regulator [Aliidongia dinghuensis]|uniref:GntR family transcriptional regulator n=1 Tax=Aliidongia dinghuensis TaxID=1867774 RepID=A0A8J2YZT0_9PROT|nr:GntR family transcriptional regulator [Aliidongia dinghuensis]GGF44393.1 GntR family transcriptional regulator [Aliidongia dinghuensis]
MTLVNDKKQPARTAKPASSIRRLSGQAAAPLYEGVKRQISEAILLGKWPPGTVLPGEVALAQLFGVAVGTVRRALMDLTAEGLLSRRRKTGTVVTGRTPHHSLRYFFQYFRLHGLDGALVRSTARLLSITVGPATEQESTALAIEPKSPMLRLYRTRDVDGRAVMLDLFALPATRIPDFPQAPGTVPELLYLFLLERYGIRISAVREHVSAELADEEAQKWLGLEPPAAVLRIEDVSYDQSGVPTIFSIHRAVTTDHRYVNEIR